MVHSNGTRWESQRFKIAFTGSTKYSGFSAAFRGVSAGGEDAARRAMPTSRAGAPSRETAATFRTERMSRLWVPCWVPDAGGPSVVAGSEMLPQPTVVRSQDKESLTSLIETSLAGLTSGFSGKSPAVVGETRRRRIRKLGAAGE